MKLDNPIYGSIDKISDIAKINTAIRKEIRKAKSKPTITKLVRRSAYLCSLSHTPAWKKKFYGKIRKVRDKAKEEYTKTARVANQVLKKLGLKGKYDTKWGK